MEDARHLLQVQNKGIVIEDSDDLVSVNGPVDGSLEGFSGLSPEGTDSKFNGNPLVIHEKGLRVFR